MQFIGVVGFRAGDRTNLEVAAFSDFQPASFLILIRANQLNLKINVVIYLSYVKNCELLFFFAIEYTFFDVQPESHRRSPPEGSRIASI